MSRKQHRIRIARRKLVQRINALIHPCHVVGFGPPSVGVQGDARTYALSVVIRFPNNSTPEYMVEISTLITNHIKQINRVLLDI